MSRQRLGQHFLANASWRARIAKTLASRPEDVWVEIGAGHGEMTEFLARIVHRVVAIETDAALATRLRDRAAAWPNVEIVHADALTLDLAALGGKRFRVYGNLPYYITSPILHHLFQFAETIESIHIVIQLEVASRIASCPGRRAYGYLSALCQYFARPEIVLRIPPGAFRPPPKVSSALVKMSLPGERATLGIADDDSFLEFIQRSFAHKRKTLLNNWRNVFSEAAISNAFALGKLKHNVRAEELSLVQFAGLFNLLTKTGESISRGQATKTHRAAGRDNLS
ncbi:MAG TPA: 16S rRNA (adenine(1518)-N(6)/adenine(1519)-N(6))-dimethyltransferase RsmA [Candidatus Acidoferrales bacterium]|nr:16S rRNA (adenine(1518)-N(6)/adenine(1519)-N(6))-dimethyltransferase RsmA [Candidatus Acidoferrales bacterium]